MSSFSRRRVLGAGALLGANALGRSIGTGAEAAVPAARPGAAGREETKSLDELYADALREGGELVVYAGGDTPTQQDRTKQAFLSRFPDLKLTMVVDYSKRRCGTLLAARPGRPAVEGCHRVVVPA